MGNYLISVLILFVINGSQADSYRPGGGVRQASGHVIQHQGGCMWSNTNKNATGNTSPFFRANSLSIDCSYSNEQDFWTNYSCPDLRFGNLLSPSQILMQYKNLQQLEFIRCNIWKFENLCEMKNLVKLNLSSNSVTELEELGLGVSSDKTNNCALNVQSLDLSSNSIRVINNYSFSRVKELRGLFLQNNMIGEIEDLAFQGLHQLRFLNLSSQRLVALPVNVFKDNYNLMVLDISNNEFTHIPASVFHNLKNLQTLDLSKNRITFVDGQFSDLIGLKNLYLDHNRIQSIDDEAFKNCSNSLTDLGLAGNMLAEIPEALKGLKALTTLDIGENKIQTIANDSFAGMSQLYGLRLVKNEIEQLPRLCNQASRLRVLNVAENKISKLSPHSFSACKELRILRLDNNQLEELPSQLPSQILWLNVSQNYIKTVNGGLPISLEWFDISYNSLEHLVGVSGPTLRVLDASFNLVKELDIRALPQLETIRLNHNRLTRVAPNTFIRSTRLRRVELVGNMLENLEITDIQIPTVRPGKPSPEFYIANNPFECNCSMEWLLTINQPTPSRQYATVGDLEAVTCTPAFTGNNQLSPLPVTKLEHNDFLCSYQSYCGENCNCCNFDACDCFQRCPDHCECARDAAGVSNIIVCNSNLTQVPHIPMDATSVHLDNNNIPTIKPHTFIGRKKMRTLFLNNSQIESISNRSFNGLKSLEVLHLEDNELDVLHGNEFTGVESLVELYLHNNRIRHISKDTFSKLSLLEKLSLHNNQLFDLSVWEFNKNGKLKSLTISGNPFSCECEYLIGLKAWMAATGIVIDFPTCAEEDSHLPLLITNVCNHNNELNLNYNRNNDNFPALLDSELLNSNHISAEQVNSDALIPPHYSITEISTDGKENPRNESGGEMLTIFTSVLITVIIVIIAIVFLLFRKDVIPFVLYTWSSTLFHCCCGGCGEGLRCKSNRGAGEVDDTEKLFDAYFIYSKSDDYLVTQKIVPHLQSPALPQYRICLHRDLCIGHSDGLSNTEIEMALTCSDSTKRIIIVLSRQFFQNELSHPGFRSAFQTIISRYQSKVVFVLLPPFTEQNLLTIYPELKSDHLTKGGSYNITSLEYNGEKSFVDKLKLLLPTPTLLKGASANSTSTISSTRSSTIFNMVPSYHPHDTNLISCSNTLSLHDYAYNTINSQHHQYHRNIIPFNGSTPPIPKHHIALTTPAWQLQNQNFYNNSQTGQIIPIPGYPPTANIPSFNESFRRHLQIQQNQNKMLITGEHINCSNNIHQGHVHVGNHHHHSHHHQGSHCSSSHSSSTSNNNPSIHPYHPLDTSSEDHVYSTLDSPPIMGSENSCETATSELNCIDEQESHPLRVSPHHQNRLNNNSNTSCPVDNNNSGTQQSSNLTNNGTNNSTNNNGTMYFV